ncbi:MAG: acyl carrier protein phosphodiesterase, partial [Cyanobacteria bacterium P01_G01_bin.49]
RISKIQGRFSGILIDIFYDHFLAYHWHLFSSDKLETFAETIYTTLIQNNHILPENLQRTLPRMVTENWLVSYQNIEGIQKTCERLGNRIKRANNLAIADQTLQANYQELESDFLTFFPQLAQYVAENRHII